MDLLTLKIICLIAVFFGCLVFALLPLKLVPKKKEHQSRRSRRILSFLNCTAGGVFLGTCFIGLFPTVRDKFASVLQKTTLDYPIAELTMILGYFLIIFIEQFTIVCAPGEGHVNHGSVPHMEMGQVENGARRHPTAQQGHRDGQNLVQDGPESSDEEDIFDSQEQHPLAKVSDPPSHSHGHSHANIFQGSILRSYILLLALSIHSIFEGMALGLQESVTSTIHLFIAVIVHEVLVSFAMGVSLMRLDIKTRTFIQLSIFFCIMIPAGVGIGIAVGNFQGFAGGLASAILQGLAAGTFIYVVFMEILPKELADPEDNITKCFLIFIGFSIFAALQFIHFDN
ncbi:zinc transporter ZIP3-like [Lineus longissimus]|uniref:zinc transporter ZIP3-like n=1 Tax=Lineus longissimus TaxID=88925 RepID=UPI00315D8DFC